MSEAPILELSRSQAVPEGPRCDCGRRGWVSIAKCETYGCAGRQLAQIKLEAREATKP